MQQSLNDEWLRLVELSAPSVKSDLKFPWETGFAALVLQPPKQPDWLKLNLPDPTPRFEPEKPVAKETEAEKLSKKLNTVPGSFKAVATRIQNLKGFKSKEQERNMALARWRDILLLKPECSTLGRKLL
ncbi:MAG: hypothetical protein EBU97_04775, partial [Rhodobacteraceae bacterium]|nr:hypothetical protein [Paracoccaceae bacterium]